MEQKNISFSYGVSRSPSIANDGELSECVNMIPKKGELVPLNRPCQFAELAEGEELLHVHEMHDVPTQYILRKKDGDNYNLISLCIVDKGDERVYQRQTLGSFSAIDKVHSIGAMLSLFVGNNAFYWQYENDKYIEKGVLPSLYGKVAFTIGGGTLEYEQAIWSSYVDADTKYTADWAHGHANYMFQSVGTGQTTGTVNVDARISELRGKRKFTRPFFVIAALRDYYNKIICTSVPVMMCPSLYGPDVEFFGSGNVSDDEKLVSAKVILNPSDLYINLDLDFTAWEGIVSSIDIFVSEELVFLKKTDDGYYESVKKGQTNLYIFKDRIARRNREFPSEADSYACYLPMLLKDDDKIEEEYASKSGSFFLFKRYDVKNVYDTIKKGEWNKIEFEEHEQWGLDELAQRTSLDVNDIKSMYFNDFSAKGSFVYNARINYYNITEGQNVAVGLKELIPTGTAKDENDVEEKERECSIMLHRDGVWAAGKKSMVGESYVRNIRHLFIPDRDVDRVFVLFGSDFHFEIAGKRLTIQGGDSTLSYNIYEIQEMAVGLGATKMYADGTVEMYENEISEYGRTFHVVIGDKSAVSGIPEFDANGQCEYKEYMTVHEVYASGEEDERLTKDITITVTMGGDGKYKIEVGEFNLPDTITSNEGKPFGPTLLSDIEYVHGGVFFELKEHPYLEGAVYTNFTAKELSLDKFLGDEPQESFGVKEMPNMIYTTVANDPFVIDQRNLLGNTPIVGVATSTKAISVGQFGTDPLYVFSGDGIWPFSVGSDGGFVSRQPLSRDVCINENSITQLDDGVVYVSSQGLKLLSGAEGVNMSSAMEGENIDESKFVDSNTDWGGLIVNDTDNFNDMLKKAKLVFDNAHRLLHIYPETGNKHYVLSLNDGVWSSYVGHNVKRTAPAWPENIIQIDNALYDYRFTTGGENVRGLAITRTVMLDNPFALKSLRDLRLMRKIVDPNASSLKVAVYGSNDDVHWVQVRSLRHHSFKYFRFVLYAYLSPDSDAISGMTLQYDYRRTNKLR